MLDQDNRNAKALFRRGTAFTEIGEFKRARIDLESANEFVTKPEEQEALAQALNRLRDLETKTQIFRLKADKEA